MIMATTTITKIVIGILFIWYLASVNLRLLSVAIIGGIGKNLERNISKISLYIFIKI